MNGKGNESLLSVIEEAQGNYSAYSPDLEGCVAAAKTREETLRFMREAIEIHIAGMQEDGLPVPEGRASAEIRCCLVANGRRGSRSLP
ncbi:MAG: type II toxin-antitoxin system HicB family antitoxin [Chloroflexi bacterium]|nr:type II toxin-antitoxin system HicB family antitoxin [Chloroflexota bacterium]